MKTMRSQRLLAVLMAALIGTTPALAGPPPWAGGGKGGGDEDHGHKHKGGRKSEDHGSRKPQNGAFFTDRNRDSVHVYYSDAGRGGKGCPPGLAKKNNGCMPPGQAKKWNIGQPLPSDVVFVPAPSAIVVTLPPVPVGHKYVQVAGDILLIAVGTKMVVDGINGLSGR
jgi:hypothetical protein